MRQSSENRVIIVGAGFGGLSAAVRLASRGVAVTVVEAQPYPGGKARQVPSDLGPVDAGPTVLTLRREFEDLFQAAGTRLDEHVTLIAQPLLARHWWPDGSSLDLFSDPDRTAEAIAHWGGARAAADFRVFDAITARAFAAFAGPVMQAARPRIGGVALAMLGHPRIWPMINRTLARELEVRFAEPRLRQLFGRYATYVGGVPALSPAILGVIWQAERQGVWAVKGGMHHLAQVLADLAQQAGADIMLGQSVQRIVTDQGRTTGVELADGTHIPASHVVFNGDPAALHAGLLGADLRRALPHSATQKRSHSAQVWAFAAKVAGPAFGPPLVHHNVLFSSDPHSEYAPLQAGRMQTDPTLYICAEDRVEGPAPTGPERFEIILNAPPLPDMGTADSEEYDTCRTLTATQLSRFGLTFDPFPQPRSLSTQQTLARLFPASAGAIYGLSPHGPMASFRRPHAGTAIRGLYLAGGGAHPGAGVPMATRSGRHAAEAIMADLALT